MNYNISWIRNLNKFVMWKGIDGKEWDPEICDGDISLDPNETNNSNPQVTLFLPCQN